MVRYADEDLLIWDGCNEAILGVLSRCGTPDVLCYDYDKLVEIFSREMGVEDAKEHIGFNILSAWIGEGTPYLLFRKIEGDELDEMLSRHDKKQS